MLWLATGLAIHAVALVALVHDRPWAPALLGAGVVCWLLALWAARGDDGADDGGGGEDPGDEPGPFDWDAFDRARAGWGSRGPRVSA
jgi:hypothetical protein